LDELLQGLRAVGEHTRLRILSLCAHAELTVSDLVEILGQSQPRVSRHLKLLVEAGLLSRHQEGPWAYYRLSERGASGQLGRMIVDLLPPDDPQQSLDLQRLQAVTESWAVRAAAYFRRNAANWERIRALHVDQAKVDAALLSELDREPVETLLDIGTGTGHVLQLARDRVTTAVGIDRSRDMLNVARANIFRAGLRHFQVRQADMQQLPFPEASFDVATLHMVLHYAERPGAAIREIGRVLRPGGRLIIADFAAHDVNALKEEHAHLWLGFSESLLDDWCQAAGLVSESPRHLDGGAITVLLWSARKPANDGFVGGRDHSARLEKSA